MHRTRMRIATLMFVATALCLGLPASVAQAHEERAVGKWHFVVGWGDEPAYAGFKNSVLLFLSDKDDKPVKDLGDTLQVEVIFGTQTKTVPMEPNFEEGEFGTLGDYRGWILPTRPGDYTFHFTGTIKGDKIDARFTSSKTTFDSIVDAAEVQFPAKDPSNADLATRFDREFPRIESREATLTASVKDARNTASQGRALAIAGLAIGVLAFSMAIASRRKKA